LFSPEHEIWTCNLPRFHPLESQTQPNIRIRPSKGRALVSAGLALRFNGEAAREESGLVIEINLRMLLRSR